MKSIAWLLLLIGGAAAPMAAIGADHGWELYTQKCAPCHRQNGQGEKGLSPALADNEFVNGNASEVVRTILTGRHTMPAFKDVLSDEDIASVLSFVRTIFNDANPVSAKAVSKVR
jgi:mono/diheme cytochrome c family protein